ncbi:protein TITANIA-like [Phoenix dactylifera]|uniref:Protein TITANIA-like n=1 Tax=Phoenix dactylifera TaxID=42345 RepID=A0A8B7BH81_PHODC|nr:protein TITANIA-like [Phoenix dactylifera]
MLADSDPSKDSASRPDAAQPNPKPLDLEKPSPRSSLFGGDGGGGKTGTSSTAAPQELTLSYLCENPKPGLQEKDGLGSDLFVAIEKARAKGKEIAVDPPNDGGERWVERDFLQLAGGKVPGKREGPEGIEGEGQEKKVKIETLNLSLGPPNLSLSLNWANLAAPSATVSAAAPAPAAPCSAAPVVAAAPVKRSFSNNTRATNSNDCGASLSYSCSAAFSHNPSCSLTRNSTENFDVSRENDTMWYAGEGTNGSVHSRFKPVGDSVTFSNLGGFPHMQGENKEAGNSLYQVSSSENISFFPAELPASAPKANAGASLDTGKGGMMLTRLLKEVVSEAVPYMAQILQDFPTESLEAVKESLRNLMSVPEKRDEFASLQGRLERRSDLTFETLSKCHKTQLEVLVAIKTGIVNYVTGKGCIPSKELVEIFLQLRCPNVNCKSLVPVDDCDCKICSSKKGFCSACMCPVCLKFDCASNTCSWVGCDVCSHWCHAGCGIEKNLIRPGPTLKGPMGMTEMQFLCPGCGHASEMFGFVKEVFNCCAKDWRLETLMKELDCVRKIFRASEDFEGKGLHAKAEEILNMLGKMLISPMDACSNMLQFFKYGVTEFSVTGSSSKNILGTQANKHADAVPLPSSTNVTPSKSVFNFKPTSSILEMQIDALKTDPKPLALEPHFTPAKEDGFQSLETIVKFKEAEANLFRRLADEARREVEGYRQIARAKSEKLEEEYTTKLAKLCLQEAEEHRRKKLEELKFLENSNCDYHNMKMRMQAEIAGLLERMEATKKMWV